MCKTVFDPVEISLFTNDFLCLQVQETRLYWLKFDSENVKV